MAKSFNLVLASLLAMLTAACASNPPGTDLSRFQSATIQVNPSDAHDAQELKRLQSILSAAIQQNGPFPALAGGEADPASTLTISVDVETIRRVSNAMRISMGRTAGSNTVSARITLLDASGDALTRFKLIAHSPLRTAISPDWPWGDLKTAMERLGEQLAAQLTNWYNQE
ncbi:MAG TPA: hypothetical protein ENK29_05325 [Chromatiales bacterium]|nr:hypothetical protein [Chromatiales bacterium]